MKQPISSNRFDIVCYFAGLFFPCGIAVFSKINFEKGDLIDDNSKTKLPT